MIKIKLYKPQKGEFKKMFIDILGSAVVAVILVALGVPSISQIIDGIGSILYWWIYFIYRLVVQIILRVLTDSLF